MVDGADHTVEVDDPVEELPRDITLQRPQERVHRHDVTAGRPRDVDEVLVAAELELPEPENPITVLIRLGPDHADTFRVGRVRLECHLNVLSVTRTALGWAARPPPGEPQLRPAPGRSAPT